MTALKTTRVCKYCKIEQPLSEFKRFKSQKNYFNDCNSCEDWANEVSKIMLDDKEKVYFDEIAGDRIYIEFFKGEIV